MILIFHIFVLLITQPEFKQSYAPKTSESCLYGLGYKPLVVGVCFEMKKGTKLSDVTRQRMRDAKKGKTPKNYQQFREASKKHRPTKEQNEKRSADYKARGIKPPSQKGKTPWNKGKTGCYSEETRNSIAKSVKEYLKENPLKLSEEAKRKIGKAHSGEKCTFWKGGVSKSNRTERENIMSTFEYQQWRRMIFERDDFTCQMHDCGQKGGKLRAHHIKKFSDYPDLRLELINGVTVCEKCDCKKVVHREKKWEDYFLSNLKSRGFIV